MATTTGRSRKRSHLLWTALPLLTAVFVYSVWLHHIKPPLTGDEACYLVQARSLARDGDLDLTNDFSDYDGILVYAPGVVDGRGCAADFKGDGRLRTWFSPGVGLLLAPTARVAFSLNWLRFGMVLWAALLAWQLLGLLRDTSHGHHRLTAAVWAASVLLLPLLGFSNQFYPEILAALACTVAARCLLRAGRNPAWAGVAACVVALLPWLHFRFAFVAVVMTGLALVAGIPRHPGQRPRHTLLGALRSRWYLALPLAASLIGLSLLDRHLYASFLPSAAYSGKGAALVALTPLQVYRVGVGSLFGPTAGIIPSNPFLWIGLVGLVPLAKRFGAAGWTVLGLFLLQIFLVNPLGFFGYTLPGRFVVVAVPLLAVAALHALEASPPLRWVAAGLTVPALLVAVEGYRHYDRLLDIGRPQAFPARVLGRIWPTTENLGGVTQFGYRPDGSLPSIASIEKGADGLPVATTGVDDGAGLVVQAPKVSLREGSYAVKVQLSGQGPADEVAGTIRVARASHPRSVLANRSFVFGEIQPEAVGAVREVAVPIAAPDEPISITVVTTGKGTLSVAAVGAGPIGQPADPTGPVRRGIPIGLAWLAATGLASSRCLARPVGGASAAPPRRRRLVRPEH